MMLSKSHFESLQTEMIVGMLDESMLTDEEQVAIMFSSWEEYKGGSDETMTLDPSVYEE